MLGAIGWLLALASVATLAIGRLQARRREVRLARATHEVRGPLQALMLGLAGLERRAGDAGMVRALGLEVELSRIVLALEDLDDARTGRHARPTPAPPGSADVAAVVRDQVAAWSAVAQRQGRTLRAIGTDVCCPVRADPARLAQATGNLVANALEHGRGDVVVDLLVIPGRAVRVEVRDGGPGPGAPVGRLVARARHRVGRHGHGLAVAAEIAQTCGGRLTGGAGQRVALELPTVSSGLAR